MISRKAFINRHKHEFAGLIYDGMKDRPGRDMSVFTSLMMAKIEAELGAAYDELTAPDTPPPEPAPGSGQQTAGNAPRSDDRGQRPENSQPDARKPANRPPGRPETGNSATGGRK